MGLHALDSIALDHDVNIRASGLNLGLIHTLTRESWEHLIWIAEFAAKSGARLLQIHPLEHAGRARRALPAESFTNDEINARAYLLTTALAGKYGDRMTVQIDLLHRDEVLRNPDLICGSRVDAAISSLRLRRSSPLRGR